MRGRPLSPRGRRLPKPWSAPVGRRAARRTTALLGPGPGLVLVLFGGVVALVSLFLPQQSPAGSTLWEEGTGWPLGAAVLVLWALTLRAQARERWSWAGFWIGTLVCLNAFALATDADFPVGDGVRALGFGGVLVLAGWVIGFAALRPPIPGLGPWASIPDVVRTAAARQARPPERDSGARQLSSSAVWSLAVYAALSLALWGWPVLSHFESTLIAENSIDPSVYTWFYAWWPHALLHGENPFITNAIFVPEGYNLTWVTAVPGPSLLMSPVTLAFGSVVTYNVLALVAPVLSGWTAFLLCRHLTRAVAPSLVGGFIFGFSPYMLRMLQGSPHLYLVALLPVFVLLVIRRIEGSLSERAFFAAMTAGISLQFLTSNDVLATSTVFGAVALAVAFVLFIEQRALIVRTAGLIGAAYAATAVLVSPVLFFMLFHDHTTPAQNSPLFAGDLLASVLPDSSLALADSHARGGTPPYYGGLGYFGVPLLLIVALFAWQNRGKAVGRLVTLAFLIPAVASLGARLIVQGDVTRIGMPWSAVSHFPGLHLLIPQRFPLHAFLAGAVIVAMWLAARTNFARWALALLVVASILPAVGSVFWKTRVHTPPFFSSGEYRAHLDENDRVITLPLIGDNMRWQAAERFRFKLAGGGVGAFPPSYTRYPAFGTLLSGTPTPGYGAELRRFVAAKGVTAVVVYKRGLTAERRRLFDSLGVRPLDTGGVLYYRLDG